MPKIILPAHSDSRGSNIAHLLRSHERLFTRETRRCILAPFQAAMIKDVIQPWYRSSALLMLSYSGELWLRSKVAGSFIITKINIPGIQSPITQIATMAEGELILLTEANRTYLATLDFLMEAFTAPACLINSGASPIIFVDRIGLGWLLTSAEGQLLFSKRATHADSQSYLHPRLVPIQNGYKAQQTITAHENISVLTDADMQIFRYCDDGSWTHSYTISLALVRENIVQFLHMELYSPDLSCALFLTDSGQVWSVKSRDGIAKLDLTAMGISEYSAKKVCFIATNRRVIVFVTNTGECWISQIFNQYEVDPRNLQLREISYVDGLARNIVKVKLNHDPRDFNVWIFNALGELYYIEDITA